MVRVLMVSFYSPDIKSKEPREVTLSSRGTQVHKEAGQGDSSDNQTTFPRSTIE